jgi:hypothetical protein
MKELTIFNYIEVERREFDNHMIYGPIPYNEVLKANLVHKIKDGKIYPNKHKNMNKMKKFVIILSIVMIGVFLGCESDEVSFPDFDYSAVYFAYQSPIRVLVLGDDDVFDNSLDNQHKFIIMATLAGVYNNNNNVTIDVRVDNSLVSNLKFETVRQEMMLLLCHLIITICLQTCKL